MDEKARGQIRKYAVKNAHDYGKAQPGPIIGKIMALPNADIKEARAEAERAVRWVNSLSKAELEKEYSEYSREFESDEKEKLERTSKPKMALPGAEYGKFHTRFAPEPSGYMHIGHAKAALVAKGFAEMYKGKITLYFDDSNPEKSEQKFVDEIKKDLGWLGTEFDEEKYASDNIERVYEYSRKLILGGHAYACSCTADAIKEKRMRKEGCIHRSADKSESIAVFEKMLSGDLEEGDAVIRFRADMKSDNTALRDPSILRIKKHEHYRQGTKYTVWPLYDLNTPINDSLNGMTDIIRSKEYELRDAFYPMVLDALGLEKPRMHLEARLVIKNNITSKRYVNLYIEEGLLSGHDDPRLITLSALRRRGVKPDAIRDFVLRFGMSKSESVVDVSMLLDENKKRIDGGARRLFYVENPVKLVVQGAETREVELKLHPSADLGSRSYEVGDTFYISSADASQLKPKSRVALKGLYTVEVVKKARDGMLAVRSDKDSDLRVQWVAEGKLLLAEVAMPKPPLKPDGTFDKESMERSKGYVESYSSKLKHGDIVQFERFGFCILDNKKEMSFIFISK
jgi:glutamyl-tRNA synthetase